MPPSPNTKENTHDPLRNRVFVRNRNPPDRACGGEFVGGVMSRGSRSVSFNEAIRKVVKTKDRDTKRADLFPELVEALRDLLARDQRNTCRHEETHRGGVLWTICDQCGLKWADDEGGMPDFVEPKEWTQADEIIAKSKALL